MMKFLVFNHQVDEKHSLVKRLISAGVDVRLARTAEEAWSVLSELGKELDLAIVHREGVTNPDVGVAFIKRVKADPVQADLPMIMTSGIWGDFDFARHQRAEEGVNGYLKSPFKDAQVLEMAEAILGQKIAEVTKTAAKPNDDQATRAIETAAPIDISQSINLEETAEILFQRGSDLSSPHTSTIHLNGPDVKKGETAVTRYIASESRFSKERREFKLDDTLDDSQGLSDATKVSGNEKISQGNFEKTVENASNISGSKIEGLEPTSFFDQSPPNMTAEIPTDLKSLADRTGSENELPTQLVEVPAITKEEPRKPPKTNLNEIDLGFMESGDPGSAAMMSATQSMDAVSQSSAAEDEVPYLFQNKDSIARAKELLGQSIAPAHSIAANEASLMATSHLSSLGDLIIPGGASQSPDTETLKKYLMLREQDVSVLAAQLKSVRDQNSSLENQIRNEASRADQLQKDLDRSHERIRGFEKEKESETLELRTQLSDAQFQLKIRMEKTERLEQQVRTAADETEKLKERVRNDLRKIRSREKELENKLEILKRDTDALLSSRESSIVELKRKIDLLEFNMDLLQDQYFREKDSSGKLKEKLERAAQAVKLAEGLLDRQEAS